MKKQNLLITTAILLSCLLNMKPAEATIIRVNNNPALIQNPSGIGVCDSCYTNLITAISSASPGDTIHLEGSPVSYNSTSIAVNKRLVIIGPGYFLSGTGSNMGLQQKPDEAHIISPGFNFDPGSAGSVLIGIYRSWGQPFPIVINADSITIERCRLPQGVTFSGATTINKFTFRQNYTGNVTSPATQILSLEISNNIFQANAGIAIYPQSIGIITQNTLDSGSGEVDCYSGVDVTNNIISNMTVVHDCTYSNVNHNIFRGAIPAACTGPTNIQNSGVFFITVSSTDGNYNIDFALCSQCQFGSDTGGEIGAFGSIAPYVLSGIPNIPTIYKLQTTTSVIQGQNTGVEISTRSNNKNEQP